MNDLTKNILVFIVIIVVLLSVVQGLNGVAGGQPQKRSYSEFLDAVEDGQVAAVEFDDNNKRIRYGTNESLQYYTIKPETDTSSLIGDLREEGVKFDAEEPKSQSVIGQLLISSFL